MTSRVVTRRTWLHAAQSIGLLVLAVAVVYGRAVTFDFVDWDDQRHLVENRAINPASWSGLSQVWSTPYDHLYIPLSYTWFALQAWVSQLFLGPRQLSPALFHAVSVLLHLACTLLAWRLIRSLVRDEISALFGVLLFAVHPLQAESVAWVSEQRGLLSAALALAAINVYLSVWSTAVNSSAPTATAWRWDRYLLATLLFVTSLLAKPSAAVVPVLVLIVAVGWLELPWRRAMKSLTPWLALSVAALLLTKRLQGNDELTFVPSLFLRPFVAGDALAFYLAKLVWPVELGFDYGRRPQDVLEAGQAYITWLLPVLVTLVALLPASRRTWLVAWGWLIVALAPVLGLVPFVYQEVSTVADRYMYLPMVGVALALAAALKRASGGLAMAIAGAGLGVLALLSFEQAAFWTDSPALFNHGLEVNPRSFTAQYNLGAAELRSRDFAAADERLRACLAINPDYALAHNALGVSLAERGRWAEAEIEYRAALKLDDQYVNAHGNLANALQTLGNSPGAIGEYRRALEIDPSQATIRGNFALLLIALGRMAEGTQQLEEAVAGKPDSLVPYRTLAHLHESQERWAAAEALWREVLGREPNDIEAQCSLGLSLARQERRDEAIAVWRKALAQLRDDAPESEVIRAYFRQWGVP
ncbi:MAG: tetratricopeptide repeat protein [Planctomycetes bacterium]|nr:tetratricopeptide repeat protein [Planctomycetota bacterium]